jgi:hypothetical protein
MPLASLSPKTATTPIKLSKSNSELIVETNALAPCGLWAASIITVGSRRTTSHLPGDLTFEKADLTKSESSFTPAKASAAASAIAALLA